MLVTGADKGERHMRHENVWELYESGEMATVIQAFDDIESLDMIHTAMFENAVDFGIPQQKITRRMEDVNYELARKHRLDDRDVAFLTRTSMAQFDRNVALDILRSQILALTKLIDEFKAAQKSP